MSPDQFHLFIFILAVFAAFGVGCIVTLLASLVAVWVTELRLLGNRELFERGMRNVLADDAVNARIWELLTERLSVVAREPIRHTSARDDDFEPRSDEETLPSQERSEEGAMNLILKAPLTQRMSEEEVRAVRAAMSSLARIQQHDDDPEES